MSYTQAMDHVAIMNKRWGLLPKIITGEKTIESRWYKTKRTPWNKVKANDLLYFKNSGQPISLRAQVEEVRQLSDVTPDQIQMTLQHHYRDLGLTRQDIPLYFSRFAGKRYAILIFFRHPTVIEPFAITKQGFGHQTAWITLPNINSIRV